MKPLRIYTSDQSEAVLFARMLCLSLREQGYTVCLGGDPADASFLLLDADALPKEQIHSFATGTPSVVYATAQEAFEDLPSEQWTLLRPFSMRAFLSQLHQEMEEAAEAVAVCAPAPVPSATAATPADELVFSAQGVYFRNVFVPLTARETELLCYLCQHRGNARSREEILRDVWQYAATAAPTNVVDVYIRYLRAKIDQAFDVRLIHAVRGKGYVIW